ncbi:MAG: NAD(P)H-quinone oxidoreductase [Clostridia bacterium]|nr:NAD(P)H-quinone oxidoreductase [Clostridia bacterium]
MKAIVLEGHGGPEVLRWREVPDPEPAADEVRVRVRATAVNRADILQRMGGYPQPGSRPEVEILGLEYAGEIDAVGRDVHGFRPGDRVMGLLAGGGYAEYVTTHHRLLMPIPDGLSFEEAAAIPEAWLTAYDALFAWAGARMGDRVLIHAGGSGVGTAATQLARAIGATVWTTVGSAEKAERSRALGAKRAIVYRQEDFVAVLREETGGRGADIILEFVGAPYLARDIEVAAVGGRIVVIGTMGGSHAEVPLGPLLAKRVRIQGTTLRSRPLEAKAALTQDFAAHALPLFAEGVLKPVVDRVFPVQEAAEAHRYMEANRNFGKIVLRVG